MALTYLSMEINRFFSKTPDLNCTLAEPKKLYDNDAYPLKFVMGNNEIMSIKFEYDSESVDMAKSNNDSLKLTIMGTVLNKESDKNTQMDLLRRWSKQKYAECKNQPDNANDDFYKEVTVKCVYNDMEIRTICFKNAYLCRYAEYFNGKKSIFELIIKQKYDKRTNVDILPFATNYTL